jgi:hypothetical protein
MYALIGAVGGIDYIAAVLRWRVDRNRGAEAPALPRELRERL